MTEITHPKLLALKEYMEWSIDGKNSVRVSFKWDEQGRAVVNYDYHNGTWLIKTYPMSFEDYYKNTYLVNPKHDLQVQNSISKLEH